MSKLEELIQKLCPNGVEYKTLGEVCSVITKQTGFDYTNHIKASLLIEPTSTSIPYIQTKFFSKKEFNYNTDYYVPEDIFEQFPKITLDEKCILFSIVGASIGNVGLFPGDKKCFLGGAICVAKVLTEYSVDYIYYCVEAYGVQKQIKKKTKGAGQATITVEDIREFVVPVPPLEIQKEIVHVLDSFTLLTAELAAELEARKKQYEFYRDQLLSFGNDGGVLNKVEWKALSELGEWSGGKTPSMAEDSYWHNGTIPWISSKDMKASVLKDTQDHITEKAVRYAGMKVHPKNSVAIVTRSGILKHTFPVAYVPFETTINQDIKILSVGKEIIPRYAFHVIQGKAKDILLKTKKQGGTVDSLDFQKVLDYKVPVPPIEIQEKMVKVLDNFEAICSDLNIGLPAEIEARQKQYEYYRDLLLTFTESGNTLMTDRQTDRHN